MQAGVLSSRRTVIQCVQYGLQEQDWAGREVLRKPQVRRADQSRLPKHTWQDIGGGFMRTSAEGRWNRETPFSPDIP